MPKQLHARKMLSCLRATWEQRVVLLVWGRRSKHAPRAISSTCAHAALKPLEYADRHSHSSNMTLSQPSCHLGQLPFRTAASPGCTTRTATHLLPPSARCGWPFIRNQKDCQQVPINTTTSN